MRTAEQVIDELGLSPLPHEGAFFVEGPRTRRLSSVLVLLTSAPEGFSAMHRLAVDEGWQWLDGAPATLLQLRQGRTRRHSSVSLLGPARRQLLVRRGVWQGAATTGDWSLVSCWCGPAYEQQHFTLGERAPLTRGFPEYAAEIAALTRQ